MTDKYKDFAATVGSLVDEKQAAYGDSFNKSGEIMAILFPNGVPTSAFVDMLAINRVVDKLFRIATRKDAFGESPWKDIAGYAILAAYRDSLKTEVKDVLVRDSVVTVTATVDNEVEDFETKFKRRYGDSLNLHHNYAGVQSITCQETGYQLALYKPNTDMWALGKFLLNQIDYSLETGDVTQDGLIVALEKYVEIWEIDRQFDVEDEDAYDSEGE